MWVKRLCAKNVCGENLRAGKHLKMLVQTQRLGSQLLSTERECTTSYSWTSILEMAIEGKRVAGDRIGERGG